MQVSLAGRALSDGTGRGVSGKFDGLRLDNLGGDFTVRSVVVHGAGWARERFIGSGRVGVCRRCGRS